MASVTTRRPVDPTPAEIEARKAEIHAQRLAAFNAETPSEDEHRLRERLRVREYRQRKKLEAMNAELLASDDAEPLDLSPKTISGKVPIPAGGPREMTRDDIANVEPLSMGDLDWFLDQLIEVASFQHAIDDVSGRWSTTDVDTDLMDLSEPAPVPRRDVVPFKAKLARKPFRSAK
jgi:hypothetical protein